MPAHTPEELHSHYAAMVTAGDLDGLLRLYEQDATFNGGSAGLVRGRAAIGERLGGFVAQRPTFELRTRAVVQAGEIALLASDWHFITTTEDGEKVDREGTSVEVARRQPDRTWLYLIDEPSFLSC